MRRRVGSALAGVLLLGGCVWSGPQPEGPTTGTGENSSFTSAGVIKIKEDRRATLDFRADHVLASDLGAPPGGQRSDGLRDVDVRDEGEPIDLRIIGTQGELRTDAEVIRILVDDMDQGIATVAIFESFDSPQELADRVESQAALVGMGPQDLEAMIQQLRTGGTTGGSGHWLKRGSLLGFNVELRPIYTDDDRIPILEYAVTGPGEEVDID